MKVFCDFLLPIRCAARDTVCIKNIFKVCFLDSGGSPALAGACSCICVLFVLHYNTSNNVQVSRHAELFVVCSQEPTLGTAYLVGAVRSTFS